MVRFTVISSRLAGVLQVQRAWTPGSLLWVLSLPWFQPDAPHPLVNSLMPFKSLYRFVLSERFGTVAQLAVTGKPFLSASDPTPGHSFPTRATRPQPCQRRLAAPQGNPPHLDLTFRGFREARHLAPCRTAEAGCGQSRDPEPAFNPRLLGPEPCSHPTSRSRYFSGVLRITDAVLGECDMIFRLKKKNLPGPNITLPGLHIPIGKCSMMVAFITMITPTPGPLEDLVECQSWRSLWRSAVQRPLLCQSPFRDNPETHRLALA